ncbi:MAG TPA: cardiolipin synthase [Acholeplasmataceae bacterium]|nr:cardiolipin synthase [Acholeplasmataceae bacterium]
MLKFLKKLFKALMSRGFIISFLLLIQLLFFFFIAWELGRRGIYVYIFFNALAIIFTIHILNRSFNPAYKISWLLVVLIIPFAGPIFYLMFGKKYFSKKRIQKMQKLHEDTLVQFKKHYRKYELDNPDIKKLSHYITKVTGLIGWENTESHLLTPGEKFFEVLLEELKKAEKFIFLEYFILEEGYMWDKILEILEEKVNQGVEVRLLYDDFGNINRLKYNFKREMINKGIRTINFNPYRPRLSMFINYRDHRKLTVIDGNVGFVGGINLADEYINKKQLFGHWKDASLVIKGDAVWNLTFLFMEMWQMSSSDVFNYEEYYPTKSFKTDGFVQPFGDGPHDNHQSIKMAYMHIINNAKRYVYITTPYLIIDNEIATALKLAALSGIDVRIMMPHIPDKKLIFLISNSYYPELMKAGVKIYEYLPGFLHSKLIVADDEVAIIGTANLDFRSFYLHFEVSCLLYKTSSVLEMRDDALKCLEEGKLVTFEDLKKISIFKKLLAAILKAFAPLM